MALSAMASPDLQQDHQVVLLLKDLICLKLHLISAQGLRSNVL